MTINKNWLVAVAALVAVAPAYAQDKPLKDKQAKLDKQAEKEMLGKIVKGGDYTPSTPVATTHQDANGFTFDFRDQSPLNVLPAIAEAGQIGLALGNLPGGLLITTRSMKPLKQRADFLAAIQEIAKSYNLSVSGTPSMLIVAANPGPTQQQLRDAAAQANAQTLHVVQLSHIPPSVLAPVLTSLFQNQARPATTQQGNAALNAAMSAGMAASMAKMTKEMSRTIEDVTVTKSGDGGVIIIKKGGGGD